MIDLDHFKMVNDRCGHLAGDRTLKAVAVCLKEELRGYDAVGRFGGEEFIALLDGVATEAATNTAVRITQAIRALTPITAEQTIVHTMHGLLATPVVDVPTLLSSPHRFVREDQTHALPTSPEARSGCCVGSGYGVRQPGRLWQLGYARQQRPRTGDQ